MIVGSGIDVIEIERILRVLERRGRRFEERVFTPHEIEFCRSWSRPAPHFAVRFAAKEAGMKAVGTGWAGGVRWQDFEARPRGDETLGLDLRLYGVAAERAQQLRGTRTHLSVGRSRSHAMAVVLLEAP